MFKLHFAETQEYLSLYSISVHDTIYKMFLSVRKSSDKL